MSAGAEGLTGEVRAAAAPFVAATVILEKPLARGAAAR
jgi:hypothetical protein